MRNTLKHLTLLTRMKDDGLLPALTGSFSEDAIAQACGQVETLQLQERLRIRKAKRIQEELIRVPNFAALYGVLCRQEIAPFPVPPAQATSRQGFPASLPLPVSHRRSLSSRHLSRSATSCQ